MKTVRELPRRVREIENLLIPMGDGVRLAARVWLPPDADASPVPAILEMIPYRKRDGTAARDAMIHPYLAGHGYACLRVDIRGSGDSEGVLLDEYLEREQQDAVEAIEWIARQPWCTGRVGMMGISWGGFNSLQVAARRPPQLGAIITLCSTDDRYADDAHYMGGCLLTENMTWGSAIFAHAALPPDPELVGPDWRRLWLQRLEAHHPWIERWLAHQRRDDYWRQGSVCEDYAAIACPVYAIGGWADAYTNAVPRLLQHLKVPRKGLIGPWAHAFPHLASPGPAIGFLQEALRWWDQWLKGVHTGVMDEPMLRAWMQEPVPPKACYDERPGRWIAEEAWPSPRIQLHELALNDGRMDPRAEEETELGISSPLVTGSGSGRWCSFGQDPDLPTDQRADDGGSLIFDTLPLPERIELLGAPVARLVLAADRPQAMVAVRLCAIAPDGSSRRIAYGLLNLSHRLSHDRPASMPPGERLEVSVPLAMLGEAVPEGYRLRLAVSTSYWPLAWPAPDQVRLTLVTGVSRLLLPVRPQSAGDHALAPFHAPESTPAALATTLQEGESSSTVEHDLASGRRRIRLHYDYGLERIEPHGLETAEVSTETLTIGEGDPSSPEVTAKSRIAHRRGDWSVRIETLLRLTSDGLRFRLQARLDAFEGEDRVFARDWVASIPRDHL
jgi:putative CocE/NonD family hydrolase